MKESRGKKAVAIRYQAGEQAAPAVTAKGTGPVADAILKQADRHQIPVVEDRSLTEVLAAIDLNQQIPPDLYQAVAEILAYVYRMDQKAKEENHDKQKP